jgi:hypothetical protein
MRGFRQYPAMERFFSVCIEGEGKPCLLDVYLLAGVNFAVFGKLVDSKEIIHIHIISLRDIGYGIAVLDFVDVEPEHRSGGDFQRLADLNRIRLQFVDLFYFLSGCVKFFGKAEQRITLTDAVSDQFFFFRFCLFGLGSGNFENTSCGNWFFLVYVI